MFKTLADSMRPEVPRDKKRCSEGPYFNSKNHDAFLLKEESLISPWTHREYLKSLGQRQPILCLFWNRVMPEATKLIEEGLVPILRTNSVWCLHFNKNNVWDAWKRRVLRLLCQRRTFSDFSGNRSYSELLYSGKNRPWPDLAEEEYPLIPWAENKDPGLFGAVDQGSRITTEIPTNLPSYKYPYLEWNLRSLGSSHGILMSGQGCVRLCRSANEWWEHSVSVEHLQHIESEFCF